MVAIFNMMYRQLHDIRLTSEQLIEPFYTIAYTISAQKKKARKGKKKERTLSPLRDHPILITPPNLNLQLPASRSSLISKRPG
jgi:hypothetical protein